MHLKQETRALHDLLDSRMSKLDLAVAEDYTAFLKIQLAARAPMERWARNDCPPHLRPPEQLPLLIEDLNAIGKPFSLPNRQFSLPSGSNPLGFAWVVAGSHLGNRAMLADLEKRNTSGLPTRFLADPRMIAFWRNLRPQLEQDTNDDTAAKSLEAAIATFRFFFTQLPSEEGQRVA
ncbi:hypothetical protein GRI39_09005 [Altererythrobacter indicus]|uniref:Heme oxygenase n=1 Tax=Altericroceibacterium indicum TaxID=374177 RepID=A0A845AA85_9SPHN|nr:biliverdin-producing heme oxygenase [Altericroceibacterium indicum]MXP26173.1 hypothetical protein [Altericroceibacterium indicum]